MREVVCPSESDFNTFPDETLGITDGDLLEPLVVNVFYHLRLSRSSTTFAYHGANLKDCRIDRPRTLTKSVTVE